MRDGRGISRYLVLPFVCSLKEYIHIQGCRAYLLDRYNQPKRTKVGLNLFQPFDTVERIYSSANTIESNIRWRTSSKLAGELTDWTRTAVHTHISHQG